MLPDRVSNPGLLTYESGALPIALRGPGAVRTTFNLCNSELSLCHCLICFSRQQDGISLKKIAACLCRECYMWKGDGMGGVKGSSGSNSACFLLKSS